MSRVWITVVFLVMVLAGPIAACSSSSEPAASAGERPGTFPAPPATRDATIWAVGDGADGSAAARRLAARIAAGEPDRFLYLGDVYETGTETEFALNYQTVYGRLKMLTAPTPGNHDWPNRERGYYPYWSQVTGRRPPDYYAFALAGWQIISLNSEGPLGRDDPQQRWLRRTVAGGGDCRLAFWHRPRYSAGLHGDQRDVAPLWESLRGRAALVVNGHDHDLQELRKREGIIELVAGAGGHSRYAVNRSDRRVAWANDRLDGALRIRLRPGRAAYAFISTEGRVLRRGRATCTR